MMMLLIAALVSCLGCAVVHWVTVILTADGLHRVPRYGLGTATIGIVYAGWCYAQPGPVAPWAAWGAWAAIALGAGLGTALAYLVDHLAAQRRTVRLLENQAEVRK